MKIVDGKRVKTGGRKPGSRNKETVDREAAIQASGLTPVDYMLSVLRNKKSSVEDKRWAAAAAAPFVHPRLSTIVVAQARPSPGLTPMELWDLARRLAWILRSGAAQHAEMRQRLALPAPRELVMVPQEPPPDDREAA